MTFGKDKLVSDEELDDFLNALGYFWDMGLSAKKIACEMRFGEPEPEGFPNLKSHHVYYFVQRYGEEYDMEPRKKQNVPKTEGVTYSQDMPYEVANYLREKNLLVESDLQQT